MPSSNNQNKSKGVELLYEISRPGRVGVDLPECPFPAVELGASLLRSEPAPLPEVSEVDVVRHFTHLADLNHSVDKGFYPLGSCTMKYNPKINEELSSLPAFADLHPLDEDRGAPVLELLYELQEWLTRLSGMHASTVAPCAGAHGEFTGLLVMRAYHRSRGDEQRTVILAPDAAHGTNPASAAMAGFTLRAIKETPEGEVDLSSLAEAMDETVAGLMLTNPNTLGLFDRNIEQIAKIVHDKGGLLYYDGANLNAMVGLARPGDMGFDIVHINTHKTFSTPHGGGGPGAGPVGVREDLEKFLPLPRLIKKGEAVALVEDKKSYPDSIGRLHGFGGNVGVLLRAHAYIASMGEAGIKEVARRAVLNANYLKARLEDLYEIAQSRICAHEFVISAEKQKRETGVTALDIAKALLDEGIHAPTVYFPLIVKEALMVEPTETESMETLDRFVAVMRSFAERSFESMHAAPQKTPIGRPDEARAARQPVFRYVHTTPKEKK